ncbi:MAG: NAD(P)H-hydrate epimerase [candidate division KSB1 bacterium]|nr:NAD(P)H-hydrate epimerase [candidate division KSB1 bacterium]
MKHKFVLRAEEMANVDRHAIERLGIPGAVLMEQAGRSVADVCLQRLPEPAAATVVVVCGRGNNGGDGFVVARRLADTVREVHVVLLADVEQVKGDALLNLQIWQRLRHQVEPLSEQTEALLARADLIVDAMLGTGARGGLREPYRTVARRINASPAHVVAVDLPTGVDANTGACDPDAIRADATVTFGALKPGLFSRRATSMPATLWSPILVSRPRRSRRCIRAPIFWTNSSPVGFYRNASARRSKTAAARFTSSPAARAWAARRICAAARRCGLEPDW